jgi:DNA-binding NarL/FixJ family response regulator
MGVSSPGLAGPRAIRAQQIGERESALAALDAALGAIGVPALVVGRKGEILCANAIASALPVQDLRVLECSLTEVVKGRPSDPRWDLKPVRGTQGYLAILRAPPRETVVGNPPCAASARWRLTVRQAQVLELVVRGLTNADIAEALAIKVGTVEFHVSAIFDKAGADNRATLVAKTVEIGRP